ncbi:MAG: hypothetical protein HQM12_15230 [SAR324 cluster bacterium]|nr:hypothetical protein [SAR324 cluster bacterium]
MFYFQPPLIRKLSLGMAWVLLSGIILLSVCQNKHLTTSTPVFVEPQHHQHLPPVENTHPTPMMKECCPEQHAVEFTGRLPDFDKILQVLFILTLLSLSLAIPRNFTLAVNHRILRQLSPPTLFNQKTSFLF